MGSTNISIRDEAYKILKQHQLQGESFSDTIIRMSKQFGNLKDSFGAGVKTQDEYETEIENLKKSRKTVSMDREIV